jgi:COMPASS component SWD2
LPTIHPIVAYDTTGVVFAVGVNNHARILVYDQSNYDKAPFLTIHLEDPTLGRVSFPPRGFVMTTLAFSADGKWILVGTSGDAHYIVDSFDGKLIAKLEGHVGLERGKSGSAPGVVPTKGISGEEVSWTPDGKFVIGGSQNGKIHLWDIEARKTEFAAKVADKSKDPIVVPPIIALDGHPGPSRCVRFNPRFAMMASAGAELVSESIPLLHQMVSEASVRSRPFGYLIIPMNQTILSRSLTFPCG